MSDTPTAAAAANPDDEQQKVAANRTGITVPPDKVTHATADLPENQRLAIRWFFSHAKVEGMTLKQAAESIKFTTGTLWRVFNGEYNAKLDSIVQNIETYKKLVIERSHIQKLEFIETSVSRKIFKVCEWALISNSVVCIYGPSQLGKTTSLMEYAKRNNHGQTKFVRMPCTGGTVLLMSEIAKACFIGTESSFEKLRARVLKTMDKNNLLIVDEVHQALLSYHKQSRLSVLDLLREIHDLTKCGLVLCGTNVFREEIARGKHKELLVQLERRGVVELQLPQVPPRRDLDAVAAAYKLKPATGEAEELMLEIMKTKGLGKFIKFIEAATKMAAKAKQPLNWGHFVSAHDIIARLSSTDLK